jgi:hypothetical protein
VGKDRKAVYAALARPVDERAAFLAKACARSLARTDRVAWGSTALGPAAVKGLFVAELYETTSNIWIGSLARPTP